MLSHVIADPSKCLALRLVHRDRIARAEWKLSPFHCHSAPWQGEPECYSREENLPVLRERFHGHVLPSDLSQNHLGVVHHAVLDGDVSHHETQAVQLQPEVVIGHAGRLEGVQELLGERVFQSSVMLGIQTCHAVQCHHWAVQFGQDLAVQFVHSDVGPGDDGTIAALERVVDVWKDELDRFLFTGGCTHRLHFRQMSVPIHRVSGIHVSISHKVDEVGVTCITGISLGMGQIPQGKLRPQWRRPDGSFQGGRSPTAGNHWRNLTEVTAADEHFATARCLFPSDVTQTAAHRLEQVSMGHWELVPNVQGSSTEKFCPLASSGDVTIGSVLAVCDGNLVGGVCRRASLVVQSGQTGGGRAQHDLSLCSHRGYDRFHQESLAPAGSPVHVHNKRALLSHCFHDLTEIGKCVT